MVILNCDSCNKQFADDIDQKLHYKSKWHRYNMKRMAAGIPVVTETLFLATKSMLAAEKRRIEQEDEDGNFKDVDPCCCFMCDLKHVSIQKCMVHMHKIHGLFIPDVEYLNDPKGLLTYLSIKVKKDYLCLYCNERCRPFSSLEAVRKHMEAKNHCKVHFGDGAGDEEAELEEFYDYSSSYVDVDGKQQLVVVDDIEKRIQLGNGGSELVITKKSKGSKSTKILGSREYLKYYRQKPRPTAVNRTITPAFASRYKMMCLATVQSRENLVRMKVMNSMNRSGVEIMRSKMGMKSNVIRKLPKNVPY